MSKALDDGIADYVDEGWSFECSYVWAVPVNPGTLPDSAIEIRISERDLVYIVTTGRPAVARHDRTLRCSARRTTVLDDFDLMPGSREHADLVSHDGDRSRQPCINAKPSGSALAAERRLSARISVPRNNRARRLPARLVTM